MGLYQRFILPRLIDFAMKDKRAAERRAVLVPQAAGTVLELGIGSGLNLPYYGPAVERVLGVDPSPELLARARRRAQRHSLAVELACRSAEELPWPDESVDTVVTTWTLCSIPNAHQALREAKRVLRPNGRLLFVEHGLSPDAGVEVWQHRLNPLWRRLAGGCNLDRRIDELVRSAGFEIAQLETGYLRGPRPFTYTYQGLALTGRGLR